MLVKVGIDGKECVGLVDTGCSQTIVSSRLLSSTNNPKRIVAVDGRVVRCEGEMDCSLIVSGIRVKVKCVILKNLLDGVDVVLGLDVIGLLGGVSIFNDGCRFGVQSVAGVSVSDRISIDDTDFRAQFDGSKWTVAWKWKDEIPVLQNRIAEYGVKTELRDSYEAELDEWVSKGWLRLWNGQDGGLLPLLAVAQENKNKVRPVLDFRELNLSVMNHTGDSDVCRESLMKWRKMGDNIAT